MRTCNRCNQSKLETDFYKNSKRIYPYCKACAKKAYADKHYKENKDKYLKSASIKGLELRKEWVEFKSQYSCQECGESRHWVLDFHHIDSSKKEGLVSRFFFNNSMTKFKEELDKCIPLCRNCHADLHYRERAGIV